MWVNIDTRGIKNILPKYSFGSWGPFPPLSFYTDPKPGAEKGLGLLFQVGKKVVDNSNDNKAISAHSVCLGIENEHVN